MPLTRSFAIKAAYTGFDRWKFIGNDPDNQRRSARVMAVIGRLDPGCADRTKGIMATAALTRPD
jgi:hypothetical protein